MRARVIVLAGPSGSGKSRLARRIAQRWGLPILRLDDFYKDGGDPTLPRIADGANAGLVDWDHPASWLPADAMTALAALCRDGRAEVPVYDIAHDGRTGWQELDLRGAGHFVAEGIFAQDVVAACREAGMLAAAYCVTQHPVVTFWRRLTRDLRERRKPPLVLVRRGLALLRDQRRVVADAVAKGCSRVTPHQGYAAVEVLLGRRHPVLAELTPVDLRFGPALRQPDERSCGAACVVVAALRRRPHLRDGSAGDFRTLVESAHRALAGGRDAAGRRQVPWPPALGTAPWAVARALAELEGVPYRTRLVRHAAGEAYDEAVASVAARPVVLYVGSRLLPRHVVLAVRARGDALECYDPGDGRLRTVTRSDLERGRRRLGGWPHAWFLVGPTDR